MTRRRSTEREVTALLRALPVPEHADDFFERLRAQLDAEADSSDHSDSTDAEVIDLSVRRVEQPERRRLTRALHTAMAPAAAVACFALVVGVGVIARRDFDDKPGPDAAAPNQLSQTQKRRLVVARPYAPAKKGLYVSFTTNTPTAGTQSFTSVISPTGDYHLERLSPRLAINNSSATGSRTMYTEETGQAALQTETDLPLGTPDGPEKNSPTSKLSRDLGASVRALAGEKSPLVRTVRWKDRDAFELTDEVGDTKTFTRQTLMVDASTGIPVRLVQTLPDGTLLRALEVSEISEKALDPALLAPALREAPPSSESIGFRPSTVADVATRVPYVPLVPTWAPAGFELANVALAPALTPKDGTKNPVYADVVALVYRKGLDSFTITTRRAAYGNTSSWTNPFTDSTSLPDRSQTAHVTNGALAGTDLHVGIYPLIWPHVWAARQQDGVLVTIAGDLNRSELLKITDSLQAYSP